jgi:PPK2 family polyphosphate:nucleotide phosphotransferase
MSDKQPLIPPFDKSVKLADYDANYRGEYRNKKAGEKHLAELQVQLSALQERLYAESKQSLLIVLQAMDTGGKDSTIKHVFAPVNPQGLRISSFKSPTPKELSHDFLWRIHQKTPANGEIGIFNRSHYEDVLIVRVNKLVPDEVWKARYEHINNFEKNLVDSGTRVLKFYLHISKDKQKQRLQERLDNPEKHWKFELGDLPVRERWDEYMEAYQDALTYCNTEYAPWHIVPANRKWYRNIVITERIIQELEDMNPQFPPADKNLDKVIIPD